MTELKPDHRRPQFSTTLITLLALSFVVFIALFLQRSPRPVPPSAPPGGFSSGRALEHLRVISQPRPMGSPENAKFRQYIEGQLVKLGLEPQLQEATVVAQRVPGNFIAGTVHNILALIKGSDNSKAVLLMGHYDSVTTGPGVGDDGSGVAVLLETARALRAAEPLKNDVILLFTDGEELGLLGAKAFIDDHPWAKQVGVALNFEARGSSGPSIMFETTRQNGWLIREFAEAAPDPVANSLSYEIYKRLPNDTDLTVFKNAGIAGLNFAFIDNLPDYHTQLDNLENLDEGSLQHHGAYAVALARHFGKLDIGNTRQADAIYFNLPGSAVVHYPGGWALPLAVFALVLMVLVVVLGLRAGGLSLSKLALATLAEVAALILASLGVTLVWWLTRMVQIGGRGSLNEFYNSKLYLFGFAAISVAIFVAAYGWISKRLGAENLMAGGALLWVLLAVLVSVFVPGASYIITWPLIFFLAGLGIAFKLTHSPITSAGMLALTLICAIPALMFFVPLIYLLIIALGFGAINVMVVIIGLLLGMLIPQISVMMKPFKWQVPLVALLLGLGMIVAAELQNKHDRQTPIFNSMFYAMNADSGKAIWASYDEMKDEWTSQFLSEAPSTEPLDEYLPSPIDVRLKSQALALPLAAPEVRLVEDTSVDGVRSVRLQIKSQRQTSAIAVTVDPPNKVLSATVNGKPIGDGNANAREDSKQRWRINYWGAPQEGIDVKFNLVAQEALKIRVEDRTLGLPDMPDRRPTNRPEQMIPRPTVFGDFTSVCKTFSF